MRTCIVSCLRHCGVPRACVAFSFRRSFMGYLHSSSNQEREGELGEGACVTWPYLKNRYITVTLPRTHNIPERNTSVALAEIPSSDLFRICHGPDYRFGISGFDQCNRPTLQGQLEGRGCFIVRGCRWGSGAASKRPILGAGTGSMIMMEPVLLWGGDSGDQNDLQ